MTLPNPALPIVVLLLAAFASGTAAAATCPGISYDVDTLLRNHTVDRDPRQYDIVMTHGSESTRANSIVTQVRREAETMDGKPVVAWHMAMTFQRPDGSDRMQVEDVSYRSATGERIGSTSRTPGSEYAVWARSNPPLPRAACVGDEGPYQDGVSVERSNGKVDEETFAVRWRLLTDDEGRVVLRLTQKDSDDQGAASGEMITDYAVEASERLALLRIEITEVELPDAVMIVTPSR